MGLSLPEHLRNEMVEHCIDAAPNEGCGLFAIENGAVAKVYPTSNSEASPSAFRVPPREHYAAITDAESRGWEIGGVFHSHPHGFARPSATDVEAALDKEWVYLVVGLAGAPEVRAWRIFDRELAEVPLTR